MQSMQKVTRAFLAPILCTLLGPTVTLAQLQDRTDRVLLPSTDRVMKKVYESSSPKLSYIYALENSGFVGLTLLKQFRNLPRESEIKCLLRCEERKLTISSLTEQVKEYLFVHHGTIQESAPVWSRNGKQIAFQSNRENIATELYVMDLDGRNLRRLTHTSYSASQTIGFSRAWWSPDNDQLAYVMHPGGPSKLFVVNADGTGQHELSLDKKTNSGIFLIGWLPDRRILFLVEGYDHTRIVYSILPDGTGLTPLTEKAMIVGQATLSPNQRMLALTANSHLMIKDLSNHTLFNSIDPVGWGALAWSPDSRQLAYGTLGGVAIVDVGSKHQTIASARAQVPRTSPMTPFEISWSPDGKQIAFTMRSTLAQNQEPPNELYAVNADGTASRPLAIDGRLPVWSPDGRFVVFSRSRARLFLVRADGSDERYLASGTYAKWIP